MIQIRQIAGIFQLISCIKVLFVNHYLGWHSIGFTRRQKTVYKYGRRDRVVDGNHYQGQINIGSNNVNLFGQVGWFAHYIIPPRQNGGNQTILHFAFLKLHPVTHGYRVGAFDSLDAEVALDATIERVTARGLHLI